MGLHSSELSAVGAEPIPKAVGKGNPVGFPQSQTPQPPSSAISKHAG